MCGACGANAPTSTVTAFLGLRGLEPAFTRTVAQRLGTRASLGRFGAHWSLRDRTGGTRLLRTAEELAAAVAPIAAGPGPAPDGARMPPDVARAGLAELRSHRVAELIALAELPENRERWTPDTLCAWLLLEAGNPPTR